MTRLLLINTLHAESMRGDYGSPRSDYALPLLTRRTLAQSASQIQQTREHAPAAVHYGAASCRFPHRPT